MISLWPDKLDFAFIIKNQRSGNVHHQLHQFGVAVHHVVLLQNLPHQILITHHLVFHVFRRLIQHLVHLTAHRASLPRGSPVGEHIGFTSNVLADFLGLYGVLRPQAADDALRGLTGGDIHVVEVAGQLLHKILNLFHPRYGSLQSQVKKVPHSVPHQLLHKTLNLFAVDKGKGAQISINTTTTGGNMRWSKGGYLQGIHLIA